MVPMRKKAEVDATDGSHIYKTNQGRFQRKEKQKEKRTGKKKDTYASTYYASLVCTSP